MWGVEKCKKGCGKVYGVSEEVCWYEKEGCGKKNGGSMLRCGALTHFLPHFPNISSLTSLPSPFLASTLTSPHPNTLYYTSSHTSSHISSSSPTSQHTFLLLSPHLPHLLKVWRSYRVTKFLRRSYCGKVTMWRSYWQPICS